MYSKNVAQVLSSRCLMKKLVDYFGNKTAVLSSQYPVQKVLSAYSSQT